MINEDLYFFQITDNFSKTKEIQSIPVKVADLPTIPRFTIAIPTYKRVETLKEAIESAINQVGYDDYDIIVVDNDSERDTQTEKLMMNLDNRRISYFKNSVNLQMAGNWNRCFELAKGEYVVMLHDDDLLLPNFLVDCYSIISNNKFGILKPLAFNWEVTEDINIVLSKKYKSDFKLQRLYDFSHFSRYLLGPPSACFFNKQAVFEIGGFNQDYYPYMDFCFTVVFSQYYPVYLYNNKLSIYRYMINDTLNLNTLLKSFEGVYYIRKQILEKYNVPQKFINKFLSCNLSASISSYKKVNPEFDFDITTLGLRIPRKLEIIIYLNIVRFLNYVIKKVTTTKSSSSKYHFRNNMKSKLKAGI